MTPAQRLRAAGRRVHRLEERAELALIAFDAGAGTASEVEIAEARAHRARVDYRCLHASLKRALAGADS